MFSNDLFLEFLFNSHVAPLQSLSWRLTDVQDQVRWLLLPNAG